MAETGLQGPLSVAEQAIAWEKQDEDGVRLYAKIGGYSGSSTRTEIAAGIIAACANGPVHIGSDSEVFVLKAKCIIESIQKGCECKCNWKLMSDGDLLEHFYEVVKAKGAQAIRITWVKGHATDQHVEKGITTDKNKVGNQIADEVADLGTALHGKQVMSAAKRMSSRHNQYPQLMKDISQHTIEAYRIHRILTEHNEKLEEIAKAETERNKVTYEPLSYPESASTRNLRNIASIHDFSKHCKANNIAHNIERFIANLIAKECESHERGITWIEIYILYRIRGNPAPFEYNEKKAKNMKTACQQIKEFTRQFRAGIARTVDEGDKKWFKPHKNQDSNVFGKLAIEANPPSVNCNISLREGEQIKIAEAIVRLSRTADKKSCNDFVHGRKQLNIIPLKLNGKAGWDKTLVERKCQQENLQDICTWKNRDLHLCESTPSYFQCPKCEHVEHSTCKSFQTKDLDVKQKCNGCNNSTKVVEWKCTCGKPWHRCDVHRHSIPGRNQPSDMAKIKREQTPEANENNAAAAKALRLNYSMSHEQMLEHETKRDKRKRMEEDEWMNEPTIDLGIPRIKSIRIASLGPRLRRKFVHPGGL